MRIEHVYQVLSLRALHVNQTLEIDDIDVHVNIR
jgi:hypothetical protein